MLCEKIVVFESLIDIYIYIFLTYFSLIKADPDHKDNIYTPDMVDSMATNIILIRGIFF